MLLLTFLAACTDGDDGGPSKEDTASADTETGAGDTSDACEPTAEVCNDLDDDCDGVVDEHGAEGCVDVWPDADGDGLGGGDPTCVCHPGEGDFLTDADCAPDDPAFGLDCADGPMPLSGARVMDDVGNLSILGVADVADTPGDELVLTSRSEGIFAVPLPDSGVSTVNGTLLGNQPLTNYGATGALAVRGDTSVSLVEATYVWEGDPWDGEWYYIYPSLKGYVGSLDAGLAAAWSWELETIYTSVPDLGIFVADLDADGRSEAWSYCVERDAYHGETAIWRADESGVVRLLEVEELYDLNPLGDPDGDGFEDLALITPGRALRSLAALPGPIVDALPSSSADIEADFWFDAVPLGDLDGDGYDDVALQGEDLHVVRGPLTTGLAVDLAVIRVGGEFENEWENDMSVNAGDVGADGTHDLVVTDTSRSDYDDDEGAVYVFEGLPVGVVDLRTASEYVYGSTVDSALGADPSVLDDGRVLVEAYGEMHDDGQGVFWLLDGW